MMHFPNAFVWGCASAAYQIEGAPAENGKGPSIWDVFSHKAGCTWEGQTGDEAADAYHRFEEDLDIMASLGIKNYRFSVSWPRVIPDGDGAVNEAGLAYYERVTDACLARGITPWVTLYHWDLPQALQDKGGWEARETAEAFARYAGIVAARLRGKVRHFFTINEPQCIIGMGYILGLHAPGLTLPPERSFRAWHNVLLAHGLADRAIREVVPDAFVSLSSTGELGYPRESYESGDASTDSLAGAVFRSSPESYIFNHQWFLDPVCLGHYPEDPGSPWYPFSRQIPAEDLEIIHRKPDAIGLNIYNGHEYAFTEPDGAWRIVPRYDGFPRTAIGWPVTPEVLRWGPRLIWERYGLPVMISENGLSCCDVISLDGQVHDPGRIDFLARYLLELGKACEDGVPVLGYFHWCFTDNYEWHSGYKERFGLIYTDYRNQRRIPKDSARWFAEVIRENGV